MLSAAIVFGKFYPLLHWENIFRVVARIQISTLVEMAVNTAGPVAIEEVGIPTQGGVFPGCSIPTHGGVFPGCSIPTHGRVFPEWSIPTHGGVFPEWVIPRTSKCS